VLLVVPGIVPSHSSFQVWALHSWESRTTTRAAASAITASSVACSASSIASDSAL